MPDIYVYDGQIRGANSDPDGSPIPPFPLSEASQLVGSGLKTMMGSRSFGALTNLDASKTIRGQRLDVASFDEILVELPNADGTGTVEARIDGDRWRTLPAKSQGDSLTSGARTVETPLGNLHVGRSSSNRVLIENISGGWSTTATNFDVKVYSVSHTEGLLERRLDSLRPQTPRWVSVWRKGVDATTVPDAPANPTLYCWYTSSGGLTLTDADLNGWVPIGQPLDDSNTNPTYIARIFLSYSLDTGIWTGPSWVVENANVDLSPIQYAEHRTGPWQATDDETWMNGWYRFRKAAAGEWQVTQLRVSHRSIPELIFDRYLSPSDAGQTLFDLDPEFDWGAATWIWFEYRSGDLHLIQTDTSWDWLVSQPIQAERIHPLGREGTDQHGIDGLGEIPRGSRFESVNLEFGNAATAYGGSLTINQWIGTNVVLGKIETTENVVGGTNTKHRLRVTLGTPTGYREDLLNDIARSNRVRVEQGQWADNARLRMWAI